MSEPARPEEGAAGPDAAGQDPAAGDEREEERPSITDVHGTIARFEMSYPAPVSGGELGRVKFGPPLGTRVPSAAYLLGAIILSGAVWYAYALAPSSSWLFAWVVEGDRGRPISASVLATVVLVSAVATVVRTHMRGVVLSAEWIEARDLLAFGFPRAARWAWPQVHRVIVDGDRVAFELWDGTFERLPRVAKGREMAARIVEHAARLRIDVTALEARRR